MRVRFPADRRARWPGKQPPGDSFLTLFTPQRLAVHPAGLRRRRAVNPLQHLRDHQHLAHAARASFVLPAAPRNSTAVSFLRVIAIPAMPASCP